MPSRPGKQVLIRVDAAILDDFDEWCRSRFVTRTTAIEYLLAYSVKNKGQYPDLGFILPRRRRPSRQQTIDAGTPA